MKKYSSYEVAKILGCDETTIRRWANKGQISCQKSAGGHRFFTIEDIRDYFIRNKQRNNKLSITSLDGDLKFLYQHINSSSHDEIASILAANSISGKVESVNSILNNLYLSGISLPILFDNIIEKCFDIIEDWLLDGKISHTDEYIARKLITRTIESLIDFKPNSDTINKNILCLNFEDDIPDLGIVMSEIVLRDCGYNVFNTGSLAEFGNLKVSIISKKIDMILLFICDRQCCKSIAEDNLDKTNKQIQYALNLAKNNSIDILFGGDGMKKVNFTLNNTFTSYDNLQKIMQDY